MDELLNLVHFGPLESVRVLPEKSCVFLSFLDGSTAAAFHADATIKKLALHGQELKIGWGKPSPVPAQVALAITQSNASRNVYVGGLDENLTEEQLRDDLSRFGLIDQVKIVRDKNIGFVHFLSISVATKVRGFWYKFSLQQILKTGSRLSTPSLLNLLGLANVLTMVKIAVLIFPSPSKQLPRPPKQQPLSRWSLSLPAFLQQDRQVRSEPRHSHLTRHSLQMLCRVWQVRKA